MTDLEPLAAEHLAVQLRRDVSRETSARLEFYVDQLRLWNGTINLVGPSTLADPWRRHVLDAGQLLDFLPVNAAPVVDLGSGAGLPGLILAILLECETHLIESDRRKAAFLRDTAARLGLKVAVHARRIEDVSPFIAGTVTARALAPLPRLLPWAARFVGPGTRCVFLEGRSVEADLLAAQAGWTMRAEIHDSRSAEGGRILTLDDLATRHGGGEP